MTVQSNLAQLLRKYCVSGVRINGKYLQALLTMLLVIDPIERLPLMEVAFNKKMTLEVVVTGGSAGPSVYFRWFTKGGILPRREEFHDDFLCRCSN